METTLERVVMVRGQCRVSTGFMLQLQCSVRWPGQEQALFTARLQLSKTCSPHQCIPVRPLSYKTSGTLKIKVGVRSSNVPTNRFSDINPQYSASFNGISA